MKLFISITLIILFGVVNCFSQTKIDSLTKLISKSKIDTSKLSLYLQIGIEYKNKNQDSASYFFEKVKKSTSKNNKFYVAQSYFEIAVFQFENKNNSQIADSLLNICLTKLKEIKKNSLHSNINQTITYTAKCLYYKSKISRSIKSPENAIKYADSSIYQYYEIKDTISIIGVYILKGNCYLDLSAYDKALKYFFLSLDLAEKIDDKNYIARNFNNIGYVYFWIKEYKKALLYWNNSLEIAKILKSEVMIGKIKLNIGNIYNQSNSNDTALIYYQEALEILLKVKDKNGIILSYNNIGNVLIHKKEYEKALFQYQKGLEFCKTIADTANMALIYNNLASLCYNKESFSESIKYANEAIFYSKAAKDLRKQYSAYLHLYNNYNHLGDFKKALENYKLHTMLKDSFFNEEKIKSIQDLDIKYKTQKKEQENDLLKKDKKLSEITIQKQKNAVVLAILIIIVVLIFVIFLFFARRRLKSYNNLLLKQKSEILQQKEEIQAQSESMLEVNTTLEKLNIELEKLSIVARETDNSVVIMDYKGNFEWINAGYSKLYGYLPEEIIDISKKNIKETFTKDINEDILEKCINSKNSVIYESILDKKNGEIIFIQTTITPILDQFFNVEKIVAIQTNINKLKNAEKKIKEQNEHIKSGIRYAKTIQNAILPETETIDKYFENFILYRPKDIVSGDFYWFNVLSEKEFETIFVAIVDCTGHGVPGAFMSVIGNNLLNEIVNEIHITEPKEIITNLNLMIKKLLRQDKTENNDGMDIGIAKIIKNKNGAKISFSGAKNSLLYFSAKNKSVEMLKGSRKSVGGVVTKNTEEYTIEGIDLETNDMLYFTTDGMIDQNNEDRKRFGTSKFIKILEENVYKSCNEQKLILETNLDEWMQNTEQRDDITVFGIKI